MHYIKNKDTRRFFTFDAFDNSRGKGDMWLVFFGVFAFSSAFPFDNSRGRNELENQYVQLVDCKGLPHQRQLIRLHPPLLHQICLPSVFQFFLPLRMHGTARERCLLIPITRTWVVKVCPRNESEENSRKSLKEIIKEVETETEKERLLRDNANIEVNGGEVEPEFIVKKERNDETKELEVGVNSKAENKISRILKEAEVSIEHESPERPPADKNFEDENISITSNLV